MSPGSWGSEIFWGVVPPGRRWGVAGAGGVSRVRMPGAVERCTAPDPVPGAAAPELALEQRSAVFLWLHAASLREDVRGQRHPMKCLLSRHFLLRHIT